MVYPIRFYGDPILRKAAGPVTRFDAPLEALSRDMFETMYGANGVGLAAPQVGLSKRIFVALETVPRDDHDDDTGDDDSETSDQGDLSVDDKRQRWDVVTEHVMVNPTIVRREGEQVGPDGCLSVPGLFVDQMKRDRSVTVRFQNLSGRWNEIEAEGHFAHVVQHELDHLDGILFIDRLPAAERQTFFDEHRAQLADIQREAKRLLRELSREPAPLPVI